MVSLGEFAFPPVFYVENTKNLSICGKSTLFQHFFLRVKKLKELLRKLIESLGHFTHLNICIDLSELFIDSGVSKIF